MVRVLKWIDRLTGRQYRPVKAKSAQPATPSPVPSTTSEISSCSPQPEPVAATRVEGNAEITENALKRRTFKMEVYEKLASSTILSQLEPFLAGTKVAVDVGGNVGHIAYFLSQHVQDVYSFEAVGVVYDQLQKVRNLASNIHTEKCAISDFCGEADLFIDHNRLSNSGLHDVSNVDVSFKPKTEFRTAKTAVRSIDSLALDEVGFIKIDVEGSELDVLHGAQGTIDRCSPDLLVEIYEPFCKYPAEEIFEFFFNRNYTCFYFHAEQQRLVNVADTEAGIHAVKHDHELHDGDFLFTRKSLGHLAAA